MRYLRMLSNALAAAVVASWFVLTLVLQLNPTLSLHPARLLPLAADVCLFYSAHFVVIFYVALAAHQLLGRDLFSPAWVSVGVLTWLVAAAAAGAAALMWGNMWAFELVLPPDTPRRMATGALILVMSAALFVFVSLLRGHLGPARRGVWSLTFMAVLLGALAGPLAVRGPGAGASAETHAVDAAVQPSAPERTSRVMVIALDGGSLDFITRATAEGRLPNFGRILDTGAVQHLATLRPTSAEAVWAAASTGKLPQKNGVRAAASYRLPTGGDAILLLPDYCFSHMLVRAGFLVEEPHTSTTLRVRTVWDILGGLGVSVGVVGWPLTYPTSPVRGYMVSDVYHRLIATPSGIEDPSAVYPADLQPEAFAAVEAAANEAETRTPGLAARHEAARQTDQLYERVARALAAAHPTQIALTRYQSLDAIGHYFLRYAMPTEFGDVTDDEERRFGRVLEQHYGLIDDAIGRAMRVLGPEDLLLVVSGYGMEPIGLLKRLLEQAVGDPELNGTHEAAPDGFLMAYGRPVARSRFVAPASIVDVTPTVLYFLGLPIGRDMDGEARTELFQSSFTAERPITYIPSYER